MSSYFNPTPLIVINGDTADAADLNDYGTSLDAAFDLVEYDIGVIGNEAELWADKSEAWAITPEDTEVEPGEYSSLHWAAKADADATTASADAASASASEASASADATSAAASAVTAEYWAGQANPTLHVNLTDTATEGHPIEAITGLDDALRGINTTLHFMSGS